MSDDTKEFVGVTVSGFEEDYLLTIDDLISLSQLLKQFNIIPISWQESVAFESAEASPDDHFFKYKQMYIERTGLPHPPVFKIKFKIKTEQLSDKEAKEFWDKLIEKNN